MKQWLNKKDVNIIPAPSRYVLKSFGGHLSIDEYRNCKYPSRKFYFSEDNKMSYINQDILEIYTEIERKKVKKEKLVRKKKLLNSISNQEQKIIITKFS